MTRGESVYGTVRRIDSSMAAMNRVLRKFGTPKEAASELRAVKNAVGEVIAQLEMAERRS